MSDTGFFSRLYIYPAIWAIIIGLLGFSSGLIWRNLSGPDEIVVLNNRFEKDTTVTIIEFKPDDKYFDNLAKMTSMSMDKKHSTDQLNQKNKTIDSISFAIGKEFQSIYDSLNLMVANVAYSQGHGEIISKPSALKNYGHSQIQRPLFKLPETVGGYVNGKINSFATVTLNSNKFKRKDVISISLDFFNKQTLGMMTPLFIDIAEPKAENSYYQIWSEQYRINELKNNISFSSDFPPGNYILSVGFYMKNELDEKYPRRYAKEYYIEVN